MLSRQRTEPRILILCGVAGSGKTTLGRLLADRLNWNFVEGDCLHPQVNRDKMESGQPLDDRDRQPWLGRIRRAIKSFLEEGKPAVLTCSALKESYRQRLLLEDSRVQLIYLKASCTLIQDRLKNRAHFFPPELAEYQFQDLEEPASGQALVVNASQSPQRLTQTILARLALDHEST